MSRWELACIDQIHDKAVVGTYGLLKWSEGYGTTEEGEAVEGERGGSLFASPFVLPFRCCDIASVFLGSFSSSHSQSDIEYLNLSSVIAPQTSRAPQKILGLL